MTLKKKKKEQFLWSILVRHDALSLSLMLLFTVLNEFNDLEKNKKARRDTVKAAYNNEE